MRSIHVNVRENATVRINNEGVTVGKTDGSLQQPFHIPWEILTIAVQGLAKSMPPGSLYEKSLGDAACHLPKIQMEYSG